MYPGPSPPDRDVNRSAILTGPSWAFATLALTFVILRLCSRLRLTRHMWWDDWAIIFAMVRSRLSCGLQLEMPDVEALR